MELHNRDGSCRNFGRHQTLYSSNHEVHVHVHIDIYGEIHAASTSHTEVIGDDKN